MTRGNLGTLLETRVSSLSLVILPQNCLYCAHSCITTLFIEQNVASVCVRVCVGVCGVGVCLCVHVLVFVCGVFPQAEKYAY